MKPSVVVKPLEPLVRGKVNKAAILVPLILEELKHTQRPDQKKVLLMANKQVAGFPLEQRIGIVINENDYRQALNKTRRMKPLLEVKPKLPVETQKQEATYSGEELLLAKKFLEGCGSSVAKARELLNLTK